MGFCLRCDLVVLALEFTSHWSHAELVAGEVSGDKVYRHFLLLLKRVSDIWRESVKDELIRLVGLVGVFEQFNYVWKDDFVTLVRVKYIKNVDQFNLSLWWKLKQIIGVTDVHSFVKCQEVLRIDYSILVCVHFSEKLHECAQVELMIRHLLLQYGLKHHRVSHLWHCWLWHLSVLSRGDPSSESWLWSCSCVGTTDAASSFVLLLSALHHFVFDYHANSIWVLLVENTCNNSWPLFKLKLLFAHENLSKCFRCVMTSLGHLWPDELFCEAFNLSN